jgi:flagellar hook assembly protein FlgD
MLPKSQKVDLKIFNVLGEVVATLVSENLSAGEYTFEWDAKNLASGIYFYRLETDGFAETRRMLLLK